MPFKARFLSNSKVQLILFSFAIIALYLPILLSSISIVLLFLSWLLLVPKDEKLANLKEHKWPLFLFMAYFLFNGLSFFYSENTGPALKDIEGKLSLLVLPLAILGWKLKKDNFKTITYLFALTSVIVGLIALIISFYKEGALMANQELAGLVGLHASYFGLYLGVSFFIVLQRVIERDRPVFNAVIAAIIFLMIVLLAARIILLAFVLINLIWFLGRSFTFRNLIISVIGFSMMAAISWNYAPIQSRIIEAVDFRDRVELDAPEGEYRTLNRNFGGRAIRVAIWQCAKDVVEENWLFGVGIGDVHDHLQQSYKDHTFEFAWKYNYYNAHNLFIETIIAFGFIGLVLLLLLFYYLFKKSLREKSLLLFSFTALFFFLSLMESTFNVHSGVVFFSLFAPLLIAQKP